uniref:Uncharacterized protein n=1 Tax=Romanomermis culicivorax TaxID=13658 RepID=A0A915HKP5_ROMCU
MIIKKQKEKEMKKTKEKTKRKTVWCEPAGAKVSGTKIAASKTATAEITQSRCSKSIKESCTYMAHVQLRRSSNVVLLCIPIKLTIRCISQGYVMRCTFNFDGQR